MTGGSRTAADVRRWQPTVGLIWRQFTDSDNWVVFHPLSGDLILMTPAARRLWMLLGEGPSDLEQLASALTSPPDTPSAELLDAIAATIEQMDRDGLIAPAAD